MSLVTFSGLASGIDSSSLIKALIDQQRNARVVPLQSKIATLSDTNESFGKLTSLLNTLRDAASQFRLLNGGPLAKTATSSNESALSAQATNGAQQGTYEVKVNSLARNSVSSFDDTYASGDTAVNDSLVGSQAITINIGTGASQEAVTLEVDATTTASDFVADFNEESDNATAALVNTGTSSSPAYKIVITSKETGTETGFISVSDPGVFSGSTIEQATDASLDIQGIGVITRSSNTISDVLSGVTFTLAGEGVATVSVQPSNNETIKKLQEFVDAYNEVVSYIQENDRITSSQEDGETINTFGTLSSTSLDESIVTALRNGLSGSSITGSITNTLADLGIATQRDGTLKLDTTAAEEALKNDPDGAEAVLLKLGEELAATGGKIDQFVRVNGLIDLSEQSNQTLITQYNDRIAVIEKSLAAQEQSLVSQFARLESLIGRLNSQQSALASLLPS